MGHRESSSSATNARSKPPLLTQHTRMRPPPWRLRSSLVIGKFPWFGWPEERANLVRDRNRFAGTQLERRTDRSIQTGLFGHGAGLTSSVSALAMMRTSRFAAGNFRCRRFTSLAYEPKERSFRADQYHFPIRFMKVAPSSRLPTPVRRTPFLRLRTRLHCGVVA